MNTIRVRIYLNTTEVSGVPTGMLLGYQQGDDLTLALTTTIMASADDTTICRRVFELLNVGDDPERNTVIDPRVVAYRSEGHRSLSVGDVIAIADRWYAVDRVGFIRIDTPDCV